jgi:uncharacterized protein with PQ loop repeat
VSVLDSLFDIHFWYSVSGTLITLLYIPQLMKVIQADHALEEISLITWGVWTVCLSVSTLYALQVTGDMKITLVSVAGTLFCGLITCVTATKRMKHQRAYIATRGQKRV